MGNEQSSTGAARAAEEAALLDAARAGDAAALRATLDRAPGLVTAHTKAGENLFHCAAAGGHSEVLRIVAGAVEAAVVSQKQHQRLKAHVNHGFNQVNQAVSQAIASAVATPLPAAMALPMGSDVGIDAQTREGVTPLMAAVKAGKEEAVHQLLALGANAWVPDTAGATALHHAAWDAAGTSCLGALLRHAEDKVAAAQQAGAWLPRLVDAGTHAGLTPLHWAAWRGQADAVKALVNAGAALGAPTKLDAMGAVSANKGSAPLHLAAMRGEAGVIWLLLRANVKLAALREAEGAGGLEEGGAGAVADLRRVADDYGKTPSALAWDMQRSDLAMILDPATPLEQAVQLAAAAAKQPAGSGGRAAGPTGNRGHGAVSAGPAAATNRGGLAAGDSGSSSFAARLRGDSGRRTGDASVDSGTGTPAAAAAAEGGGGGGDGGSIFLEPPRAMLRGLPRQAPCCRASEQQRDTPQAPPVGNAPAPLPPPNPQQQQQQQWPEAGTPGGAAAMPQPPPPAAQGNGDDAAAGAWCEPPPAVVCPITNEPFKDPVRAADGLLYEREAIEMWFLLGNTSFPGGRSRITTQALVTDEQARQAAVAWRR